MRITPTSENSCLIRLGEAISPAISAQVAAAAAKVRVHYGPALIDCVPSYASLQLTIDLSRLSVRQLCNELPTVLSTIEAITTFKQPARRIDVPVCYDIDLAPDLQQVATDCGLSVTELVERHQAPIYRVYAIGFAPGFCFLGELDPRLALPRRATPRLAVPAGSVAIAERQTAVYPSATPGGWHLIGRTPLDMRALCCDENEPVRIGDELRFIGIDKATFRRLGGKLA